MCAMYNGVKVPDRITKHDLIKCIERIYGDTPYQFTFENDGKLEYNFTTDKIIFNCCSIKTHKVVKTPIEILALHVTNKFGIPCPYCASVATHPDNYVIQTKSVKTQTKVPAAKESYAYEKSVLEQSNKSKEEINAENALIRQKNIQKQNEISAKISQARSEIASRSNNHILDKSYMANFLKTLDQQTESVNDNKKNVKAGYETAEFVDYEAKREEWAAKHREERRMRMEENNGMILPEGQLPIGQINYQESGAVSADKYDKINSIGTFEE